jgi:hypothetical protein
MRKYEEQQYADKTKINKEEIHTRAVNKLYRTCIYYMLRKELVSTYVER